MTRENPDVQPHDTSFFAGAVLLSHRQKRVLDILSGTEKFSAQSFANIGRARAMRAAALNPIARGDLPADGAFVDALAGKALKDQNPGFFMRVAAALLSMKRPDLDREALAEGYADVLQDLKAPNFMGQVQALRCVVQVTNAVAVHALPPVPALRAAVSDVTGFHIDAFVGKERSQLAMLHIRDEFFAACASVSARPTPVPVSGPVPVNPGAGPGVLLSCVMK